MENKTPLLYDVYIKVQVSAESRAAAETFALDQFKSALKRESLGLTPSVQSVGRIEKAVA